MTIQEFENNNNFTLKNLNDSIDNYINRVKADMVKFSYNRDYCRYLKGMLDGLYTAKKNAAVNLNIIIFEDEENLKINFKEVMYTGFYYVDYCCFWFKYNGL